MSKQQRKIEVFLRHFEGGVYGELLGANETGAIEESVEAVLETLQILGAEALSEGRMRRSVGADPTVVRHLRLNMPVLQLDSVTELTVYLLAICTRETNEHHVYLPQLGVEFYAPNLDQLEMLSMEHVRSHYFGIEERLGALSRYAVPINREPVHRDPAGEPEPPIPASEERLEVRTIEVRFEAKPGGGREVDEEYPTLTAVAEPLHLQVDKKDAPQAFERRGEVETLLNYLSGLSERSVLLTGAPGVGKTCIVHDAVGRIVSGQAPENLRGPGVWQISGGRLMAGMRFLGQWQERAINLIEEVKRSGAIIFAENLIELLETSGTEQYAEGIPGLLLPHILSGDIVLVTEARPEQLAYAEQRHPSFLRALRRLPVEPLSSAQTDNVLERVSYRLGRQHGVRLTVEARQTIVELSSRFRGPGRFPGPAVELAERMARTHRTQGVIEDGEPRLHLLPEHAVGAYASLTGLPRELLDSSANFAISGVERHFKEAVFGQPEALQAMVDLVTVIRAGLNAPTRPLGSYLFLGPTGVGKTQTALTLASYLFGSSDRLLRFDMSEYQDPWSAARLVGRYKGQQGELVRRIREQPFQVILLDEIEKAHSTVFDFLLQMLGEGRLTDALGQTVSVTSAVVLMTSNLGAGGPASLGFGAGEGEQGQEQSRVAAVQHYHGVVEEFFRPEFIGRIDRVIAFRSLRSETARSLVERALSQAFAREGLVRRNIKVRAQPEVIDYLIGAGLDERYGARPLRQAVEKYIVAGLASFLSLESDVRDVELVFEMVDGVPAVDLGA